MAVMLLGGCSETSEPATPLPDVAPAQRVTVTSERITNLEAPVPPQCYTRTDGRHNPCYTCHQMYDRGAGAKRRMNELDDGGLQGGYLFSEEGLVNHWSNLFVDRRDWLADVSDDDIVRYVATDNYAALDDRLRARDWPGFIPDLAHYAHPELAFDEQGFARDDSGWVAFNYKPFPGTFWPTNGSTDDVAIRLPQAFRQLDGKDNRDIYLLNLTLVEMNIKNLNTLSIPTQDEQALRIDLDADGTLSAAATRLVQRDHYLGDASPVRRLFQQYPEGTELMHSVRYVGVDDQENIFTPPRMKELRYMKKIRELPEYDVGSRYARERKEKIEGLLPTFVDHRDKGMENGYGWMLQGYIEDYDGALRPQTHEETMFCMGCHAAVGVTIDHTFALARKVDGAAGWGYIDTRGMPDVSNVSEPHGEIANYLARAGGGSEFRENTEMLARWYRADGSVDLDKVRAADVYTLITPSRERALALNKAYTHIVRHQSYIHGRDATWLPTINVFREVDENEPPLEKEFRFYHWDIRLDWRAAGATP
ncbi:MAG: hypothetical protein KDH99_03030 [Alcanivoracaceae bacterium]|nr:hypothetical protein [Alcanivoracaceae bacterium]